MYSIMADKWTHDGRFNVTKNSRQHIFEFRGNTLKEAMSSYQDARDNNDMTKYTRINIYNVISTDEQ